MNRILADVKAFGTQYLRARTGAFFAFAFPIILILLFGAIFSGGGQKVPLYVQDLDDTPQSHTFLMTLNDTNVLSYRKIPSGAAVEDYIRANRVNAALVIPRGFGDNVTRYQGGDRTAYVNVTFYGDPTQSSYGIALAAIGGATTQFNFRVARQFPVVGLGEPKSISGANLRFIDLFLPGVIGLTVLTNPLFGMTNTTAEYRTRKFFKFLATTTLTKGEWLAAKVVFWSITMLASVAVMLAVNALAFQGKAVITPMAVLLILAGTVLFTSLGMILGLYVKDVETANAVANAIGFPMMFLGGSFFPIDTMPAYLQAVSRALPLTYVNEGLRATMVFGNEATAFTYFLVVLALAAVFFIIPARALSWKSK